MKPLQKHIFYFFCFALFMLSGGNSVSAMESTANINEIESLETTNEFTFSDSNDHLFFDSQLTHQRSSVTHATRQQNNSRRVDTEHKNNFSFIRAGKIVNIVTIFCFHNTFKLKDSFFSEPLNILLRFGKFII